MKLQIRGRNRGDHCWPVIGLLTVLTAASSCKTEPEPGGGAGSVAAAETNRPVAAAGSVTPKKAIPSEARALSDAFAGVAAAIRPSVVRIDVEVSAPPLLTGAPRQGAPLLPMPELFERFFGFGDAPVPPSGPVRGTGSGVLLDSAGHVLTNAHVVERPGRVTVTLAGGKKFPGRVIGRDPMTDVAVVKIDNPPADLIVARLGDEQQLRIGEWVLAVGSPLGMQQTVTAGIVSGLGKTGSAFQFASGRRVRSYVQTDAKINPGNSGGPLVSLAGEVVGINTLINVGPGGSYGFALPMTQVREVAAALIKEGRVRYPYLGVLIGDVSETPPHLRAELGDQPPAEGAVVTEVTSGSPAAAVGIRPGDVITRIGEVEVGGADDVIGFVADQSIGAKVPLSYVRRGEIRNVEVTLAELPTPREASDDEVKVGVRLQTITPQLADALRLGRDRTGAVITEVLPDSIAARAGLAVGDVIVEINRKPIATAEEAAKALREARGTVLLRVANQRGSRFLSLDLGVG